MVAGGDFRLKVAPVIFVRSKLCSVLRQSEAEDERAVFPAGLIPRRPAAAPTCAAVARVLAEAIDRDTRAEAVMDGAISERIGGEYSPGTFQHEGVRRT